jgi:hypothetical protein
MCTKISETNPLPKGDTMHKIPESLKDLSRASRDFAELKMTYKDPEKLCRDIRELFDLLYAKGDEIDRLSGRINEIRNCRDSLLADVQSAMKKFDFTMRSL